MEILSFHCPHRHLFIRKDYLGSTCLNFLCTLANRMLESVDKLQWQHKPHPLALITLSKRHDWLNQKKNNMRVHLSSSDTVQTAERISFCNLKICELTRLWEPQIFHCLTSSLKKTASWCTPVVLDFFASPHSNSFPCLELFQGRRWFKNIFYSCHNLVLIFRIVLRKLYVWHNYTNVSLNYVSKHAVIPDTLPSREHKIKDVKPAFLKTQQLWLIFNVSSLELLFSQTLCSQSASSENNQGNNKEKTEIESKNNAEHERKITFNEISETETGQPRHKHRIKIKTEESEIKNNEFKLKLIYKEPKAALMSTDSHLYWCKGQTDHWLWLYDDVFTLIIDQWR